MTLLDTNIVIHALRGNEKVVRRFEERAGSLALPAMVLGELLYGVAKSGNPAKNGELLESLVGTLPIIHTDNEIMQMFADQKAALSIRGEAVEDADTLIVATAIVYGATLATGNMRHFTRFAGLRMENWCA